MHKTSLLNALSPDLRALVEQSLGEQISNVSNCREKSQYGQNEAKKQQRKTFLEEFESDNTKLPLSSIACIDVPPCTESSTLNPSEIFVLRNLKSPGFVVKSGFLGTKAAKQVYKAVRRLRDQEPFSVAGIGQGTNFRRDPSYRGDSIYWLPNSNERVDPSLLYLLRQVERMIYGLKMTVPELDIRNVTSKQVAIFPGDGSRFIKHTDAYDSQTEKSEPSSIEGMSRCITCVYYVNPFWKVKDEGYLRIYTENDDKYWDVSPILDKLVVFRSSDVPHEVMPTYAERFAITVWYYSPTKTKAVTGNKLPVLESKQILYQVPDKRHLDEQAASIFVSIPSYRDSECEHTIKNLFMTARNPDRIFVGLCLQYIEGVDNVSFFQNKDFKYSNQIRICWMKARDAKGPCLARSNAQKLYAGEEFYLQIDSHMRFREHWDTFLINELAKCTPQKSIITSYPLGYTLPNMVSEDIRPTLLCAKQFDSDGMLRLVARILKAHTKKPLSSSFWAAGFAFSRADVIEEVPYDPTLNFLFFGEEMIMSARLWTNGWNFFAPTETIVYHLWSRDYRPVYHEVMDDENLRLDALRSVQSRLGLIEEPHIGIKNSYELGKERSLDDFQKAIGIDFKSQTIEWRAEWANFDPILFDLTASFEQ